MVLDCGLALHTCAIESHVPIGQILQEGQQVAHDIIQAVVIHLVTDALDHVLRCSDDVLVQVVGILALEDLLAHSWVEDERLVSALLKSRDVLDAESVGVEPWKEDVSHDGLDAVFRESESLSSHNWAVTQVKTASVSTNCVCDE